MPRRPTDSSRPRVVIVGGGFAGLYAAKALRNAPVAMTVVDRTNYHLFQPMLYQVASAALDTSDIASPIRSILRHQPNTEVLMAEVTTVHRAARRLELADGSELAYDYLLLAPGVRHSYFGHDEWEASAPGLKTADDAEEVRRRVLLAFEAAERETDIEKRRALLTFVVVGGGPTGVEVAGALAEIRQYALKRDFRRIDPRAATVMLLEGGRQLLPSYPAHLADEARESLRRLGVDVRTETFVTDVQPDHVSAGRLVIPTHTVVWAAGNRASPLLASLGAPLDRFGRALVEPDCSIPGHAEIFVLGDAAAFPTGKGDFLPGLCPVAIQQGKYAASAILADIRGKPRRPFRYTDKGQLAVIGRGRGVADLGRLRFSGFPAWIAWIFIHIFFLIGFRNRLVVLIDWAISYVTYARGARVITGRDHRPAIGHPG
ncbi:MAG TPA: NAD(P)/FAD-dependent oxidoreductase [Gemmatimonadales bacterium]|nr:NAD(P)/FAD-dependent oxidoreductase [Gemmatimonadales bacterium]